MADEIKINKRLLLVIGKACLDKELPFGKDLEITIKGSLMKAELEDNIDETFDKLFKFKIASVENVKE